MKKAMAVVVGLVFLFSATTVIAKERNFWQRMFNPRAPTVEKEVTTDVKVQKKIEMKAPTVTGKPIRTRRPPTGPAGRGGGGGDSNEETAAHCATAYQEIANALAAAPSPSLTFFNSGVSEEMGSFRQKFECFFEGVAPTIENSMEARTGAEELSKCRDGLRDADWNRNCVHPQDIRPKMNEVKAELAAAGWNDSIAVNPTLPHNQVDSLMSGAFEDIDIVPYIVFYRTRMDGDIVLPTGTTGDLMLLRALAGFEDADKFFRAELPPPAEHPDRHPIIHYMTCVAAEYVNPDHPDLKYTNITDFADACR